MGQQPNIELEISDLPRPRRKPDPARGWIPGRPGELGGPEDMRSGAGFGSTGPDAGYALSLAVAREVALADGEHRGNANAAIAAVASARSSGYGRGPTKQDIDFALVLLGYNASGISEEMAAGLATSRLDWFAAAGHHPGKLLDFIAIIPSEVLQLTADEAAGRMAQGEELVTR
ncbi:MAG: hypothetical protein U9N84_11285 [Actinomycetota bacterium]|nr:hypothetical protein [Actinomycetota bacterium]